MGLIEKFLMKVDNAYSKKEFDEKAYLINFILNEAHTVIRPINNKFWCYYLNLSNEPFPDDKKLGADLLIYSGYVSQILNLHNELITFYETHKDYLKSQAEQYAKLNKSCLDLYSHTMEILHNYEDMNRYIPSKENSLIIDKLSEIAKMLCQHTGKFDMPQIVKTYRIELQNQATKNTQ